MCLCACVRERARVPLGVQMRRDIYTPGAMQKSMNHMGTYLKY